MTEYIIREVGLHQWLLFADRESLALCTTENEAVNLMMEDSARRSFSLNSRPVRRPAAPTNGP
jgi:hypothetical protein